MLNEEVLNLKKGDKILCEFKTSRTGIVQRCCTFRQTFRRKGVDKLFAMVEMDGNILGNLFPVPSTNILKKIN